MNKIYKYPEKMKKGDLCLINNKAWGDLALYKGKLCRIEGKLDWSTLFEVSIIGMEMISTAEKIELTPIPEELKDESIETILLYLAL